MFRPKVVIFTLKLHKFIKFIFLKLFTLYAITYGCFRDLRYNSTSCHYSSYILKSLNIFRSNDYITFISKTYQFICIS